MRATVSRNGVLLTLTVTLVVFLGAQAEAELSPKNSSPCGPECKGEAARIHKIWQGFRQHVEELGREELLPAQDPFHDGEDETDDALTDASAPPSLFVDDPEASDPIRGILFRLSGALIDLDEIFQNAGDKALEDAQLAKANALAGKLQASDDPYLQAYGQFYGSRLLLQEGKAGAAVPQLEALMESSHFLPRRSAQRFLTSAYRDAGDDTLALLELQLLLVQLPEDATLERDWANEELRKIRAREHPGPLKETGERMLGISKLLGAKDVGDTTQGEQERVEKVLAKIVQLLEAAGGG